MQHQQAKTNNHLYQLYVQVQELVSLTQMQIKMEMKIKSRKMQEHADHRS